MLDSNEYIFAFGLAKRQVCVDLLRLILEKSPKHSIHICRTIVDEVREHLFPKEFREFIAFIANLTTIDEDIWVPFELGAKYETKGFKGADAFIAAFTEWTGSEALVTENRHFLTLSADLPFKVLTAENCLNLIEHL